MKLRLTRKTLLGFIALLLPVTLALIPGKHAIEPLVPNRITIQKKPR
jgi:hypothetical protein